MALDHSDNDPFQRFFRPVLSPLRANLASWRFWLSIVLLVGTIVALYLTFAHSPHPQNRWWQIVTVASWSIGIPLWFGLEYAFMLTESDLEKTRFKLYRYGVDCATRIWAAGSLLLAGLLLSTK